MFNSIFALNQIKNIRLLVYIALVRSHIEYRIITWGGGPGGEKKTKLHKIFCFLKIISDFIFFTTLDGRGGGGCDCEIRSHLEWGGWGWTPV